MTAPAVPTKGLSEGMPYWPLLELLPSTSMRWILPSGTVSFWALPSPLWPNDGRLARLRSPSRSSAPPPSPVGDVELAVGAEGDVAAVVVELRVVDPPDLAPAGHHHARGRVGRRRRPATRRSRSGDWRWCPPAAWWEGGRRRCRARWCRCRACRSSGSRGGRPRRGSRARRSCPAQHAEGHEPARHVQQHHLRSVGQVDRPELAGLVHHVQASGSPGAVVPSDRRA